MNIIVHELDCYDVNTQVDKSISYFNNLLDCNYESYRANFISEGHDDFELLNKKLKTTDNSKEYNRIQSERYRLVRVIERHDGFYLVYGDDCNETSGTGYFETMELAKKWFFGGG